VGADADAVADTVADVGTVAAAVDDVDDDDDDADVTLIIDGIATRQSRRGLALPRQRRAQQRQRLATTRRRLNNKNGEECDGTGVSASRFQVSPAPHLEQAVLATRNAAQRLRHECALLRIGLCEWKHHVDAIDPRGRHQSVNVELRVNFRFIFFINMSDADARRREQRKRELEEKRLKLQQFKDQNTKLATPTKVRGNSINILIFLF
jgi:hypothetical protein